MSDPTPTPTQAQIREARHAGFNDSVSHMQPDRRTRLTNAHRTQDNRREQNITNFYQSVTGK